MTKYHNAAITLVFVFLCWVLLLGCAMRCSFVRTDAEIRIAVSERAQREAEATAAVLLDQLEQRSLLPEGMADPVALGEYMCTAYCAQEYPHICGGNGITASGTTPTPGITAAADWDELPAGSVIYIEDIGIRVIEDTGGAINGRALDVLVETHDEAERWAGYGPHRVWLLQKGEEDAT